MKPSLNDQMNAIMGLYPLGKVMSVAPAAFGATNQVVFVDTDLGHWVVIVYQKETSEQLLNLLTLQHQLNELGVHTVKAIKNHEQQLVTPMGGANAVVYKKIPGQVPVQSAENCAIAGEVLANLHQAKVKSEKQLPIDTPLLLDWLNKDSTVTSSQKQEALTVIKAIKNLGLPCGFIHADWFMENAIQNQESIVMIDWELGGQGSFLFDLAVALNDWAIKDGKPNFSLQTAFLIGYQSVRTLNNLEQENLNLMRQFAALRFWLSRIFAANPNAQVQKNPDEMWVLFEEIKKCR